MRLKVALVLAGVAVVPGAGVAIAAHATEIDPATVPTGFFVAHNYVDDDSGLHACAGGRTERRRCVRPAPDAQRESGVRMAHPSRTGGRYGPERVLDLPDREKQHVPRSGLLGRSGIRRSRLRPRAPRDRGPVRRRHLCDVPVAPRLGEPPDRGPGTDRVRVARRETAEFASMGAARAAPSRCTAGVPPVAAR